MPALAPIDVYPTLGSSPRGLTGEQAGARLARVGPNELPRARPRRLWRRFLAQFADLFAVVLLIASGITMVAYLLGRPRDPGNLQLALAILAVVLLNAVIGFSQEYSAERTAQALAAMVPRTCRVLRGGDRTEVAVRDLVPGDVVVLEAGDAVPADCRVVDAHELAVNNAALTGESEPAHRDAQPVPAAAGQVLPAELPHLRNHVFMGTTVAAGSGKAVVFATGADTEFGRICRLAQEAPQPISPLQREVASMARRVSGAALAIGAVMFAVRLPSGQPFVQTFVFALGVMVALVPEGLPATLSVSLAIGVRRMARRHALVKRLLSVEALGSTTVICTDKTGTLTKAEMTVTQVWNGTGHPVTGVGYAPAGEVSGAGAVRPLLRAAALCGNARLLPPDDAARPGAPGGGWRVLGDTTEGALLVAAAKAGVDLDAELDAAPRVGEFPFDPGRKLMSTVHREGTGHVCYVKGAPQELLNRCLATAWAGPLTPDLRAEIAAAQDRMAGGGLRVLAVGAREVPGRYPGRELAESGLVLLGLIGMVDPPRPEVAEAVRACRRAGIRIVMVTGDHPLTAEVVARRVGIVVDRPTAVTGARLDSMTEADLDELVGRPGYPTATGTGRGQLLFCRVSPEHKMRVVAALKRRGETVAVTGDGANDAPALKRADIGVAMGASGTDVAREAADMVLLDDSFASVAAAVELGRSVYHNIRKFLVYLFSHNIAELVPILVATFVGFPLVPLTAVQVLAIDLGSDVLPALALGAEPPESDAMDRPPRARSERLLSADVVRRFLFLGAIQSIGVCLAFFWRVHSAGIPFDEFTAANPVYREAITMVQAGIVVSQFFNALAVRTDRQSILRVGLFSNPALLLAGGFGLCLMAGISYLPPLQAVFHTAPLSMADWAVLTVFGLLLLLAEETRKWWRRHRSTRAVGEVGTR